MGSEVSPTPGPVASTTDSKFIRFRPLHEILTAYQCHGTDSSSVSSGSPSSGSKIVDASHFREC